MIRSEKRSKALYEEALTLLPGGVDSPVRAFRSVGGIPLFMKKGEGAILTDEDDNQYIDFCMSWGPHILGHADPDVLQAIQETAIKGTSFGTPHQSEIMLARRVINAFPSIENIRFVNSGTEATMSAVRLARGYTKKKKFIKFDGCYHGHGDFLLVAAGSGAATFGIPDSAGVTEGNARDTVVVPYNDSEALERVLNQDAENIAAVIMEPVPCNCGLILPKKNYLKKVRELCDHHKVVLIFDEVISGFRLAPGGAQEYFGVQADLTTLGKIIGGGLPVGAYGGKKEIMEQVAPNGPVYQAGTLSGNPLAMAAGIAVLEKLISEKCYPNLREKAALLKQQLKPVLEKYQGRVLFTQLESIFAFSFTDAVEITSPDAVKKSNMDLYAAFHRELLIRGVYLAPSGYEVGFLSLAHTEKDLDKTAAAITEALDAVFD